MERALGSRYRLGKLLGSGTTGQVFEGVDTDAHEFAFKVLRRELIGDPFAVGRLLQERSILVSLVHPNLVVVHDLVVEGETVAVVMDLVRGGDLRQQLTERGPLLPSEVARIGARVASALAAVHAAGVVHRDVKPENILLDVSTTPSTPRLTDFGISSLLSDDQIGRTSLLVGTPKYIAPEIAEGEKVTSMADLYSLGIVLYEMCCGVAPFTGNSIFATIRQHVEDDPGRPDGIPDELWEVISWLLRKSPRARPTAQQVEILLDRLTTELLYAPVAPRLHTPPPVRVATRLNETYAPVGIPSLSWRKIQSASYRAENAALNAQQAAGQVAAGEMSLYFGRYARRERATAEVVRGIAVLAVAAGSILGWLLIRHAANLTAGEVLQRTLVVVPLVLLGGYLSRESTRHRRTAQWADTIQVQLRTFDAFCEPLDESSKQELRIAFGRQIFLDVNDSQRTVNIQDGAEPERLDLGQIKEIYDIVRKNGGGK